MSDSPNFIPNSESKIRKVLFNEITFIIAIVAALSSVIYWVQNPQQKNDVAIQLQDQRITSQQKTIDELTKTQQNDIQEVKKGLTELEDQVEILNKDIVKLQTIIDERIPKKK